MASLLERLIPSDKLYVIRTRSYSEYYVEKHSPFMQNPEWTFMKNRTLREKRYPIRAVLPSNPENIQFANRWVLNLSTDGEPVEISPEYTDFSPEDFIEGIILYSKIRNGKEHRGKTNIIERIYKRRG